MHGPARHHTPRLTNRFHKVKAERDKPSEAEGAYQHAVALAVQLLAVNPARRPSAMQALDHDFFWTTPAPADPATCA